MYYMNVVQLFYKFLYVNIGGLLGFYQAYRVETAGFCGPHGPHGPGLDGQMVSAVDRKGAMDDVHRLTFILAARHSSAPTAAMLALVIDYLLGMCRMPIIDIWKVLIFFGNSLIPKIWGFCLLDPFFWHTHSF